MTPPGTHSGWYMTKQRAHSELGNVPRRPPQLIEQGGTWVGPPTISPFMCSALDIVAIIASSSSVAIGGLSEIRGFGLILEFNTS